MIDIGKQITAMRRARDMTQEQLATLIGVSAQTVSKWECGTTMPDILLLPVLAEIFETSIDALFGIELNAVNRALHTEKTEAVIDDILLRMWCEDAPKKDASHSILSVRESLDKNRNSQSMWLAQNRAGIFVDRSTAVVNRLPRDMQIQTLGQMDAAEFLSACTKPYVMRVLQYQLDNNTRSFTAATAAAKCGISEEESACALEILSNYGFTLQQNVDLPDGTLIVYRSFAEHKLLLLSALFSIAEKIANYQESYNGFCG